MDALQLLKDQHEEVDELVGKLEKGSDDRNAQQRTFEELADKLAAHAMIEEQIFYPAVKVAKTRERLEEAVEEHLSVKRLLADMMNLDVEDDSFTAKLTVLKEQLEHHAHEEEEKKLFPEVKTLLSGEQLEALGGEMLALYEELLEGEPRRQIPSEISEAAQI